MIFFKEKINTLNKLLLISFLQSAYMVRSSERQLIEAIERMKPLVVEQLLDSGSAEKCMLEKLDDGSSPLHLACRISDSEDGYIIFKILLKAGCCPKVTNKQLEVPFHDSCYLQSVSKRNEVIEDLLLHGGRLMQEDINGKTILERLIDLQSQNDIEEFLKKFGVLLTKEDLEKSIKFSGSRAGEGRGFTDITGVLKKYFENKKSFNSIFDMIILKDVEGIKEAIEKNHSLVDSSEKRWGYTPLMISILRNEREIIELLLNRKASLSVQDKYGRTALHIVIEACLSHDEKIEIIRLLVKHGADSTKQDFKKRTPLDLGIKRGIPKEVFDIKNNKR